MLAMGGPAGTAAPARRGPAETEVSRSRTAVASVATAAGSTRRGPSSAPTRRSRGLQYRTTPRGTAATGATGAWGERGIPAPVETGQAGTPAAVTANSGAAAAAT